ncbi:pyrroloquinoline quinone precursor peptide PqqA [Spirillospora sp. NPDC029432]
MTEHTTDTGRSDDRGARWVTPDFEIVETSLEVTAYFTAES